MSTILPKFLGKNKDAHYTWAVLTLYLYKCFSLFYVCLCVKSVTLESNNDIHIQNNTLVYDNQFCF